MNKIDKLQEAIKLSDEYRDKYGQQDKALEVLCDAQKYLDINHPDTYYPYFLKLSALYRDSQNYDIALGTLLKLLNTAQDIYLADIKRSLSFIYLQKKDIEKAIDFATDSLKILENNSTEKGLTMLSNTYAVLGNIYFTKKDFDSALLYYNKGLDIAKKVGFTQRILTIVNDIANVYLQQNRIEDAQQTLISLQKEAEKKYRIVVPQLLIRLARVYMQQNRINNAISTLNKSLEISKSENWKRDIAEASEALSLVYIKQENLPQARKLINDAKKIYIEMGLNAKAEKLVLPS